MSYLQFGKKIGVSNTTLHRIERGEHHLTLHKLDIILKKLKAKVSDVFTDDF